MARRAIVPDGPLDRPSGDTMSAMKGRVLVVDDDTALAEMLGIVLRGEGFEPSFCADGDRALAAFRDARAPTSCCST